MSNVECRMQNDEVRKRQRKKHISHNGANRPPSVTARPSSVMTRPPSVTNQPRVNAQSPKRHKPATCRARSLYRAASVAGIATSRIPPQHHKRDRRAGSPNPAAPVAGAATPRLSPRTFVFRAHRLFRAFAFSVFAFPAFAFSVFCLSLSTIYHLLSTALPALLCGHRFTYLHHRHLYHDQHQAPSTTSTFPSRHEGAHGAISFCRRHGGAAPRLRGRCVSRNSALHQRAVPAASGCVLPRRLRDRRGIAGCFPGAHAQRPGADVTPRLDSQRHRHSVPSWAGRAAGYSRRASAHKQHHPAAACAAQHPPSVRHAYARMRNARGGSRVRVYPNGNFCVRKARARRNPVR